MYIPVTTAGAHTPITQNVRPLFRSDVYVAGSKAAVCYTRYMESIGTINASYYCERDKPNGPIVILTTGAYRVAEFDGHTGTFKWHRVVPAPQKSVIENWLNSRFPRPEAVAEMTARKKAARQALATV